ncbi:MAG: hypothetical protein ACRER1_06365 [Gammaproteobacteria bacterium]
MTQLTVRGFDKRLAHRIRQIARHESISLNKAALKLMRRGAGLHDDASQINAIGDRLDGFIGSWDKTQAEEFERETSVFETVDAEQWQ